MVHIHNVILLSHKKRPMTNNVICINMDGPRNCYTEWSKPEKHKYHMILFIHGIKKKEYKRTYLQNRGRDMDV